jgi:hypothetical protein
LVFYGICKEACSPGRRFLHPRSDIIKLAVGTADRWMLVFLETALIIGAYPTDY